MEGSGAAVPAVASGTEQQAAGKGNGNNPLRALLEGVANTLSKGKPIHGLFQGALHQTGNLMWMYTLQCLLVACVQVAPSCPNWVGLQRVSVHTAAGNH